MQSCLLLAGSIFPSNFSGKFPSVSSQMKGVLPSAKWQMFVSCKKGKKKGHSNKFLKVDELVLISVSSSCFQILLCNFCVDRPGKTTCDFYCFLKEILKILKSYLVKVVFKGISL